MEARPGRVPWAKLRVSHDLFFPLSPAAPILHDERDAWDLGSQVGEG